MLRETSLGRRPMRWRPPRHEPFAFTALSGAIAIRFRIRNTALTVDWIIHRWPAT
jgi:hypothetical protein